MLGQVSMNEKLPKIQEEIKPGAKSGEVTLTDLMKLAEPLLKQWTDTENEKHKREIEYDREVLRETGKQNRRVTIGFFIIAGVTLGIAGMLLIFGRDSVAMDLIKLIVGIGGAAFGGYGWALARRRKEGEKS